VSKVTGAADGAVHLNQTVVPRVLTPWDGSPVSVVASATEPA
jgi:hypothetical protein